MTIILPKDEARVVCQEAIALARAGDRDAARKRLRQAAALDPANEVVWLYLAGLTDNRQEAEQALERVEHLNPANPYLVKARAWVQQSWPEPTVCLDDDTKPIESLAAAVMMAPAIKKSSLVTWQLAGTAAVVLLVMMGSILRTVNSVQETARGAASNLVNYLFPTPTNTMAQDLNRLRLTMAEAEVAGDRQAVIENLEKMYAQAPYDQAIMTQLAERYYEEGVALRNDGNFEAAQIAFNQALAIKETMENAQLEQQHVSLYLRGVAQHQQGNWAEAIAAFEEIYRQTPDYPFLDEILYSAYFNQGLASQANGDLEEGLDAFKGAAKVLPDVTEAKHKAEEVTSLLDQSTSTSTSVITKTLISSDNKLVIVDISEQRAYSYQGNYLVDEFVVSTGAPGLDTALGEFEIQNKIPVAYASTWNLDMPFWLGIYWSGSLQNGFHALPTVRHTGVTMWDDYLGQRVSFGCIVLSMEDAETLYNWVDVGTPVKIQW